MTNARDTAAAAVAAASNPTPIQPWGEPLRVLEVAEKKHPEPHEDGPAWGRTVFLTPQAQKTGVIRVTLDHPEPLMISIDELVGAAPVGGTSFHVWAQVTIGSGAASVTRTVNCDYRIDLPVCAAYVDVVLYLGDAQGNQITAQNASVQVQVAAQLARGIRGLPYSATLFAVGRGSSSATAGAPQITGPARLVSIAAHLDQAGAGASTYLQLFDQTTAPAANATPTMEFPLGTVDTATTIGTQELGRQANFRGFANGIYWALSSTSGTFTATAGINAWVEIETLRF